MVIINDDYENAVIKGKGVDGCSVDEVNDPVNSKIPEASQTLGVTDKQDNRTIGLSEDELFAQFLDAEEKAGLLRMYTPDKAKKQARRLFNCALGDMQEYGVEVLSVKNLADIFKSKGNDAMMLFKEYPFAIFSYTVAIALCGDNAIYYCNRAAAYTQTKQYTEAISDCQKAIELDSSYRKAYSRLGSVYFAQGKYNDAIHKGFKKALQLDPDNESMKGYIQAA
ncbi:small glutamine-rich tetratricopeptide repeat-containing protein 2-like [Rutidosis leptorrhynchoides]|uniref:small glutamine-rich tetratricopeptide repeat-containing protein 2-like n=1 Tax=Rutidosis leptorrhynchoides TaxID=125765 RepID=UPI003A99891F